MLMRHLTITTPRPTASTAALIFLLTACSGTGTISSPAVKPPFSSSSQPESSKPTQPTGITEGPTPLPAPAEENDPPQINWDEPIPGGITIPAATIGSVPGGLSFTPTVLMAMGEPALVRITNPLEWGLDDRTVAFLWRLGTGVVASDDRRVVLYEKKADITSANLQAIADNPPGPKENYKIVTINGEKALFNFYNNIGRVRLIHDGVLYDLTGPALPPDDALRLAAKIAAA